MQLYCALAAARPDAFTPDLAGSLHNLAICLSELGRREDALAAAEEAVRLLKPYFLQQPAAFAKAIIAYARDYIRRCELAGREPDVALFESIMEAPSGGRMDRQDAC